MSFISALIFFFFLSRHEDSVKKSHSQYENYDYPIDDDPSSGEHGSDDDYLVYDAHPPSTPAGNSAKKTYPYTTFLNSQSPSQPPSSPQGRNPYDYDRGGGDLPLNQQERPRRWKPRPPEYFRTPRGQRDPVVSTKKYEYYKETNSPPRTKFSSYRKPYNDIREPEHEERLKYSPREPIEKPPFNYALHKVPPPRDYVPPSRYRPRYPRPQEEPHEEEREEEEEHHAAEERETLRPPVSYHNPHEEDVQREYNRPTEYEKEERERPRRYPQFSPRPPRYQRGQPHEIDHGLDDQYEDRERHEEEVPEVTEYERQVISRSQKLT